MKKIVYGVLGLLVLIVVAAVAIPFLIPAEKLKEELILAVNDATGRTLSIDGEFGVSVFPVLGVNASKVSFSNSSTSQNPNMATIENLTVALNLMPLLSGQIQVDTFVLDKPVIYLEAYKKGTKNWEFSSPSSKTTQSSETSSTSDGPTDLGIQDLNLGNVKIVDGAITYSDGQSGAKYEISAVNLVVTLNGLDKPFKTNGSAIWNGEKIELSTELGALRTVLENKKTVLKAAINSSKVNLTYDGTLNSTTPLSLKGQTALDVPSLVKLTEWVGEPLEAQENTFGPVSINGVADIMGSTYAFEQANLSFDKIAGKGDFKVSLENEIPYLEGKLDIPLLDINPYLSTDSQAKSEPSQTKKNSKEKWDSTPIDFSGLKAVNAKFDLSVGSILIQKIKIGKSTVAATLKSGVLNIGLTELNLYSGKGNGAVTVNAKGKIAKITNSFTLENIQLNPLLTDAADFDKLEGTGLIKFAIKTSGTSQKSFVSALNGTGNILFENGAIRGVNLASMARNITTAFTDSGKAQKTDFAELSGTFTIKNGLLNNNDLKMLNPFVRLSGKGNVNMPPKTLDYRVEPKVVANTEGQGGKDSSGLVVPIKISGSWDNPKFAPDLAGVITKMADPEEIKKKIEETGKGELDKVLKGGLKGGLKGLFGKTN